jgi:hypothetical protein
MQPNKFPNQQLAWALVLVLGLVSVNAWSAAAEEQPKPVRTAQQRVDVPEVEPAPSPVAGSRPDASTGRQARLPERTAEVQAQLPAKTYIARPTGATIYSVGL